MFQSNLFYQLKQSHELNRLKISIDCFAALAMTKRAIARKGNNCITIIILFLSFYMNACNGCSNHSNEHDAGSDVIDDMAKDTEMDETKTEDVEKDIIEDAAKDAGIDWGDFQGEWINPWDMNNLGSCCDSRCRKITNIKEYMEKEYEYSNAYLQYYDVYEGNVLVGVSNGAILSAYLYYINTKDNNIKELYNLRKKLAIANEYNIIPWGTWGASIYKNTIMFPSSYAPRDEYVLTNLELYKYDLLTDKVEKLYHEECEWCYARGDDQYNYKMLLEMGPTDAKDLFMFDLNTMSKTRLTYTYSGMQSAYIYGRYVVVNYNNSVAYIDLEDPQYTLHRVVAHGPGEGWNQGEGRIYDGKIIFGEGNNDQEIQKGGEVYIYDIETGKAVNVRGEIEPDTQPQFFGDIYKNIVTYVENTTTTGEYQDGNNKIYIKNMDTGEQIEITENFESMAGKPCYPRLSEGGFVYFEDMYDIYLSSPKGGELWVCDYSDFFQ